jgi:L-alanine-DL-glutamate epimerase-like enolase superfamily enzyme
MKFSGIAWAPYNIPFVKPYETAHGRVRRREGFIIRVLTDGGVTGLGEASLDPASPAPPAALGLLIESLARKLLGADEAAYDAAMEPYLAGDEMSRAVHCALQTAFFDASGRTVGLSVAAFFSNMQEPDVLRPERLQVQVNATVASRDAAEAVKAAREAVAAGFRCIKVKAGMESTIEAEVARVRAIREAIGPDVLLRLDANGAWDEATAIATIGQLERFDLELIEQPVTVGDLGALGRVRAAVSTGIAADESVTDNASAERSILNADALVLKPMRLGGLSVTRYIAQDVLSAALRVIITTTIDAGIGTAAALHIAASLPDDGIAHGLATASLLASDLLKTPLAIDRGTMTLPRSPGLGVDLDDSALAKYVGPWREVT